jgi:hypothetical protein
LALEWRFTVQTVVVVAGKPFRQIAGRDICKFAAAVLAIGGVTNAERCVI